MTKGHTLVKVQRFKGGLLLDARLFHLLAAQLSHQILPVNQFPSNLLSAMLRSDSLGLTFGYMVKLITVSGAMSQSPDPPFAQSPDEYLKRCSCRLGNRNTCIHLLPHQ